MVTAVLVLILVTIIAATLMVERSMPGVAVPTEEGHGLGRRVLVALEDPDQAQIGFAIAARIAAPDTGVIRALRGTAPADIRARESTLAHLRQVGFAIGVDTDPSFIVHGAFAEGIVNAVADHEPPFVLIGQRRASVDPALGSPAEAVAHPSHHQSRWLSARASESTGSHS